MQIEYYIQFKGKSMKILKNMVLLGLLCSGYSVMAMDEDEEFRRAIAESLKESEEYSARQAERDARAEAEFEEQKRAAIAASKQEMAGSQAGRPRMTMTSFGQGSSSRQPQVTNSNRPPLSKAEREAAQAEAEFEEQMRAAIAASKQEMAGPQARQNQMPMTSFGQSSSSRQPQVTNFNRPPRAMEVSQGEQVVDPREAAAKKILKFYKRKNSPGIKIFGRDEPIELELEKVAWNGRIIEKLPTEQALTDLLNTHEQGKDYIPGLPKVIVKKKAHIGAENEALFVAFDALTGDPVLFLKISKELWRVPEKLDALQKGPVGRFGFMAMKDKELPIIVLQEVFFIYKDKMGDKHTIEVMHLAHGEMVSDLMQKPGKDQGYAEKIGKALGLFHVYFMNYHNSRDPEDWTTMLHGDFHASNVFFNEERSRTYFIDNGRMRKGVLMIDLNFLYDAIEDALVGVGSISHPEVLSSEILQKAIASRQMAAQKLAFLVNFIKGYLSAYPSDKRELMRNYLKTQLEDRLYRPNYIAEYQTNWRNFLEAAFGQTRRQ